MIKKDNMNLTPITAKIQKSTKGGIKEPLLNVGKVEGGSSKGCGCGSPAKQTRPAGKKSPSFIDSAKSYFKGEQGLIPDFNGKPTRQAMDESQIFNPKSSSEIMSDKMDSKMRTHYLEKQNKGQKLSSGEQRALNYYSDKAKQIRPNKKNRYSLK
jgi:hypothetical protein